MLLIGRDALLAPALAAPPRAAQGQAAPGDGQCDARRVARAIGGRHATAQLQLGRADLLARAVAVWAAARRAAAAAPTFNLSDNGRERRMRLCYLCGHLTLTLAESHRFRTV